MATLPGATIATITPYRERNVPRKGAELLERPMNGRVAADEYRKAREREKEREREREMRSRQRTAEDRALTTSSPRLSPFFP
jgi:hypothetical protein